jgi:hypothetical protein
MGNTNDESVSGESEDRSETEVARVLRKHASERILVLDGAMGTMIQALGLDERAIAARGSTLGTARCAATTIFSS